MDEKFDINYYDYDLPLELIAQVPLIDRASSKLLVLDKKTGKKVKLKVSYYESIAN